MSNQQLDQKLAQLRTRIEQLGSMIVCFSGGLDSAFLLAVARQVLGDQVVAVTADSPSLPATEREDARQLVDNLGSRHEWVDAGEFRLAAYRANGADRCYHCKKSVFKAAQRVRERLGFACVVDGAHADDVGDYRPGNRAAEEEGIIRPLQETGFTKADIRLASRAMGLQVWSKPSAACLASRVPYGTPIDEQVLARIDGAEAALRRMGFEQVRVRFHGAVARIEVSPEELAMVLSQRNLVVQAVKAQGFDYVTADLEGYRMGSHNEVLPHSRTERKTGTEPSS